MRASWVFRIGALRLALTRRDSAGDPALNRRGACTDDWQRRNGYSSGYSGGFLDSSVAEVGLDDRAPPRMIDPDRAIIKAAAGSIRQIRRGSAVEVEFDSYSISERVGVRPDWNRVLAAVGRVPGVERLFFAYSPGYRPLLPTAEELWSFLSSFDGIKDVALCEVQVESFAGMPDLPGLNRLGLMSTGIATLRGCRICRR